MNDKINKKNGAVRRQERLVRENREKKKLRLTAVTIVVVLALLFCGAMLINSNYIRRSAVAISAGGMNFSPAEYSYFFSNSYSEYQMMVYENMPDYASALLPDSQKPLKSQIYEKETGETWADFFQTRVFETISRTAAVYKEAQNAGFVLPEEKRAAMEEEFSMLKANAGAYGYSTFNKYLQAMYGPSMNEKVIRRLSEITYTVAAYSEYIYDSFSYTDDKITAYYDENKDKFDVFAFRYILVKSEDIGVESDYATPEEYKQVEAAALAVALAQGEEIAAGIKTEQDFIDVARRYDAESYALDDSTLRYYKGELLGDTQGPWLRDPARVYGDVTAIEFISGCYVQFFIDRSPNEYPVANIRQLVIRPEAVSPEDYPEGEADAAYIEDLEKAKSGAKDEAEFILGGLETGGGTEEKFIELIEQYSEDAVEGGLYENVYMHETENRLAPEVNAWPFGTVRKAGDYELISTEDGSHYIVFLSSFGELYNVYLADSTMRDIDYTAWSETLVTPEVKRHWALSLAD